MWYVPILLRIAIANIASPILHKKITQLGSLPRRFRSQYLATVIIAWIFAGLAGTAIEWSWFARVLVLGIFQVFGTYCMWQAVRISLSRTGLVTQFDDLIGMSLGYLLLGETYYLRNGMLAGGVALALVGVFVYVWFRPQQNDEKQSGGAYAIQHKDDSHRARTSGPSLAFWVAGYSVIWGIAFFALRYFALADVSPATFLAGWYSGSLIGACAITFLVGADKRGKPLKPQEHVAPAVLAVFIFLSLALQYWASKLSPITVHQPIYQVTEMIFPVLIGFYVFKEIKGLTASGRIAFALGIAGMLFIVLSYRGG